MAGFGLGPFLLAEENPGVFRSKSFTEGDKVRHNGRKKRGVIPFGVVVVHEGRLAVKWDKISNPEFIADIGYGLVKR